MEKGKEGDKRGNGYQEGKVHERKEAGGEERGATFKGSRGDDERSDSGGSREMERREAERHGRNERKRPRQI